MNLPNKLTIMRICLIPLCVILMYIDTQATQIAALIVFLIASFTDFLDGHIARSKNIVTNLGKFLDPVADKLLVLSMMIMLVSQDKLPAWLVIVVMGRELAVDGLRMINSQQGKVIAASSLGKIKTVFQIATITVAMLGNWPFGTFPMTEILSGLTVFFTLWSGIDYFKNNGRSLFSDKEGMP